jgi:hypothetical protein
MRQLMAAAGCVFLAACGSLAFPPQTPPTQAGDCWFLDEAAIGWEGHTTLGQLGMGGPGGRWDDVEVYAWITRDRIDLWGGAELTQAVCAATDDREFIAQRDDLGGGDTAVVWNEYPVVNGGPDPGFGRDD